MSEHMNVAGNQLPTDDNEFDGQSGRRRPETELFADLAAPVVVSRARLQWADCNVVVRTRIVR